jgi:VWFA-related protein
MRSIAVATLGVLFAGSIVGNAQQTPPPTFRAGTTLVDFTMVAVDAQGNPVTDLRQDEISIVEDNANRPVAFFQFEGSAVPASPIRRDTAISRPPGIFSNRPEHAPGAPRNLIAIVLDLLNTTVVGQVELQSQLLQDLKLLPADSQVGLYILGDHAIAIQDFTQDAESLRTRLEKGEINLHARALASLRDTSGLVASARAEQKESLVAMAEAEGRATGDLNMQVMRDRREKTLAALESVGQHLAGVRGRKSIVWISNGFPLTSTLEASFVDEVRGTAQRLATTNVAIYPVSATAGGLAGAALHGGGLGLNDQGSKSTKGQTFTVNSLATTHANRARAVAAGQVEGTRELMASVTGGRVTRNTNDLTEGVSSAAGDLHGTYSLGFYTVNEPDNRWHRLTVNVSRPGVTVRHRQGYLAASTAISGTQNWTGESWNAIAYRPLLSTDVNLDARATYAGGTLKVALDIATRDLQFLKADTGVAADLDIAIVERTATGPTNVRVQSASVQLSLGAGPATVLVASEFALSPQTVAVRVIVRDKSTGRNGSVDVPLAQVPDK